MIPRRHDGGRGRRGCHLRLVPGPPMLVTFSMPELLALEDEELDQIDAITRRDRRESGDVQELWWSLWRLEQAERR